MSKTLTGLDVNPIAVSMQASYGVTLAECLPYSDELLRLASRGIFVLAQPNHCLTHRMEAIATRLIKLMPANP